MARNNFMSRKKRNKAKIFSRRSNSLRLAVFRSSKHISVQIIDDKISKTLIFANDLDFQKAKSAKQTKSEIAKKVGIELGQKAKSAKIEVVVFDRSGYRYHGRVKALAEGARESGLKF